MISFGEAKAVFLKHLSPRDGAPAVGSIFMDEFNRLMTWDGKQWIRIRKPGEPDETERLLKMLEKYPTLRNAWSHFQIVLRMCEAEEANSES